MVRGVDLHAFARGWGRAGAVGLLLALTSCSTRVGTVAAPSSTSAGVATTASAAESAIVAPATFTEVPAATSEPVEAPLPPATAATGSGLWAVVIGIADYPGRGHDLAYARNDTADIIRVLERAGQPAAQRAVLVDGAAGAAAMRRALDWLAANAGPDATAVVYFAGHVRKLARTTEAFVGADGRVVADHEVAAHLEPLRAGRTWFVVAGCYGGGFTEVLAPGRLLTAAAPAHALAYETAAYSRSYLGEFLVHRGLLQGQGGPTAQSAFAYADSELRRSHPGRVPVQVDRGAGPIVLTDVSAEALPPSPPPATTAPRSRPPRPGPTTTSTTSPRPPPEPSCVLTAGSIGWCPDRRDD